MKLDAIIHALVPKDTQFFQYFEADVENLLKAASVLKELMSPSSRRARSVTEDAQGGGIGTPW